MKSDILQPAVVLVAWSLIVLLWMFATRLPALRKAGIDLAKAKPGGRGQDLDRVLPANINWISHNFSHLMEAPTLFYALVAFLAISGHGNGMNAWIAWAYVALRIVHSLWQMTVNKIMPVRFSLYTLSTLCLLALTVHAAIAVFS